MVGLLILITRFGGAFCGTGRTVGLWGAWMEENKRVDKRERIDRKIDGDERGTKQGSHGNIYILKDVNWT